MSSTHVLTSSAWFDAGSGSFAISIPGNNDSARVVYETGTSPPAVNSTNFDFIEAGQKVFQFSASINHLYLRALTLNVTIKKHPTD
jgi:hypothetical protein